MGIPNLALRGSIYWWRRKVSLGGRSIALALSLRTGIFHEARLRAACLAAEVEKLRMAYGERWSSIDPTALKNIFKDAMCRQLERIEFHQTVRGDLPSTNSAEALAYAENYLVFDGARHEEAQTCALGLGAYQRDELARSPELPPHFANQPFTSRDEIKRYAHHHGISPTADNCAAVERAIIAGKEEACRHTSKQLGAHRGEFASWADQALAQQPLAFGESADLEAAQPSRPLTSKREAEAAIDVVPLQLFTAPTAGAEPAKPERRQGARPKMLLKVAAENCIRAHQEAAAWSPDTIEQVRAAIRLFDFACGENFAIDDLNQDHVTAFYELCKKLPNRWGKTTAEKERGLSASVEYGEKLAAGGESARLGFSTKTMDKHITWISVVLDYADNEGAADGHRPAAPLRFKTKRTKIGEKAQTKKQRARDARSNWNREEIARLLQAPVWHGCAGLDDRFMEGPELYHDAWYWLPLMYVLYGGRSSELAALHLHEVHEKDEIPYFRVDYNDLRELKNAQSIRKLPIHPELIRLGFIEYVTAMRGLGHALLFPEMHSPRSKSFASTFYKSVFTRWRAWGFPNGTTWRHRVRGVMKDKDVHSFRGVASSLMQGKVPDSVRIDILGHEGENTTKRIYDEEAALEEKLRALQLVSVLTEQIQPFPLNLRPADRQKFGARRGAPRKKKDGSKHP